MSALISCFFLEDEFGDLPWHHIQLYRLYGRETADDFLYPKVETERKRVSKGLDPRFKSEEGSRLSANDLWLILRGESKEKLLQEDELIPPDLKVCSLLIIFMRHFLAIACH